MKNKQVFLKLEKPGSRSIFNINFAEEWRRMVFITDAVDRGYTVSLSNAEEYREAEGMEVVEVLNNLEFMVKYHSYE